MRGLSLIQPVDPAHLDKETQRIYEICDGCRRCFNLCPSFNTLLNGIDRHDGDVPVYVTHQVAVAVIVAVNPRRNA